MEVKLIYSKAEFDMAVKFIARNNRAFLGANDVIKSRLYDALCEVAKDPNSHTLGTMGFMLMAFREDEGIDCDETVVRIDIFVDPALGLDHYHSDDEEEIILTE